MGWFDLRHRAFVSFVTGMREHGMLGDDARFLQGVVVVVKTYQLKEIR